MNRGGVNISPDLSVVAISCWGVVPVEVLLGLGEVFQFLVFGSITLVIVPCGEDLSEFLSGSKVVVMGMMVMVFSEDFSPDFSVLGVSISRVVPVIV